jgi:hypothetical protein
MKSCVLLIMSLLLVSCVIVDPTQDVILSAENIRYFKQHAKQEIQVKEGWPEPTLMLFEENVGKKMEDKEQYNQKNEIGFALELYPSGVVRIYVFANSYHLYPQIEYGDQVLAWGGVKISSMKNPRKDLGKIMQELAVSQRVSIVLQRGEKTIHTELTIVDNKIQACPFYFGVKKDVAIVCLEKFFGEKYAEDLQQIFSKF